MKILFMSRNGHDKNMTKMYENEWSYVLGVGMDLQAKEWSFLFRMVSII